MRRQREPYSNKSDAYLTFKKMLVSGHPPDDWDVLLKEAQFEIKRLVNVASCEMKAL